MTIQGAYPDKSGLGKGHTTQICINDDRFIPGLVYVDENGEPFQPVLYTSDSVWSYEVGSKNILFDNRLSIDASAYVIDWTDIQSQISLPPCAQSFTFTAMGKQ